MNTSQYSYKIAFYLKDNILLRYLYILLIMAYKLQQIYDVTIVVLSVAFEKNINDIVNIVVISSRYRLF